ncbi:MAG: uracil-DNA glycosylase [Deltaproteobacteria bacterium]|nr:uracil-DNA glycosylase [Deltaproteobacteria bacterium]
MSDLTKIVQELKETLQYHRQRGVEFISRGTKDQGPRTMDQKHGRTLEEIRAEIGDCKRCRLCEGRTNIVFGVGNPHAKLMFVGEAPGRDEDKQGEPFVGRAGQLLNKIIEAMKMKREDVYIGNINKCRPPENRPPQPDEVATCIPFLQQQIAFIKPKVIVCLGSTAFQHLLKTENKISHSRGQWFEFEGIKVMPTYHPAFLLRNPDAKKPVWEDMQKVMKVLKTA